MSERNEAILSSAAGRYREFRPPAALQGHFERVWTNTLQRDGASVAVVPDGRVDITWVEGRLVLAGPDLVATLSPRAPKRTVIGFRFRAGAASAWLGLPMSEIVSCRLPLSEFWGKPADEIETRMRDASSTEERMRVMETILSNIAIGIERPPPDMGFVFNALKTESAGPGMATILDRLDVSPRTLRRRCQIAFGYGPKTLDRILRFQRFLALARHSEGSRLAGLAFEAGYADQVHLTREVRRLSGFSPAEIMSQIGP